MDIPTHAKSFAKKFAEYAAFLAVFGTAGSYWIDSEVERRMKELAKDPSVHPVIVEMRTRQEGFEEGQRRIETKVDLFSDNFLRYLERQAQ
jgi:hypothetical protein